MSVSHYFLISQKYDTNGLIELIRPFRKNTLSIHKRFSGANYDTFRIRQCLSLFMRRFALFMRVGVYVRCVCFVYLLKNK